MALYPWVVPIERERQDLNLFSTLAQWFIEFKDGLPRKAPARLPSQSMPRLLAMKKPRQLCLVRLPKKFRERS
jgi:hypothetical protein